MNALLLTAATPMAWIMQMVVTIAVIAGGWWGLKKYRENPEKNLLLDFFAGDITFKLEVLAAITTTTECVSLSIMAIGRGVQVFNACSRYLLFCGIEIAVIFYFIKYSTSIQNWLIRRAAKNILEDGQIDFTEWLKIIGGVGLYGVIAYYLFPYFCLPTLAISYLYLEASGVITISFGELSWYPWELIKIEEAPDVHLMGLELAAWGIIWLTPLITLGQIIFTPMEIVARVYGEYTSGSGGSGGSSWDDDEDDDWGGGNSSLDKKVKNVLKGLSEIHNITESDLTKKFDSLIGKGGKTPTNPSIKNKSKTVDEFKKEVYNLFMGSDDKSDPKGILGFRKLEQLATAKSTGELEKIVQELTTQEGIVNSSSGTRKSNAEAEVVRLKAEKKKALKEIKNWEDTQDDIKSDLKDYMDDIGLWP